jgi:hypothetical protein
MPVAEITRRLQAALVNRPSTLKPPAKSSPCIDITPGHRQTCAHDHKNPFLHA